MARKTYYVETTDEQLLGEVSARDVGDLQRKADAAYRGNMDTFVHDGSFSGVARFYDNETGEHVGWFSNITGRFTRRP